MKKYWTEEKKEELWKFWNDNVPVKSLAQKYECSLSAIRHIIIKIKKERNLNVVHHPREKEKQVREILKGQDNLRILECFSGQGNLTKIYKTYGSVITIDNHFETKKRQHYLNDSFKTVHKLIYDGEIFNVIDIDSYGFPSRHFPHIFQLIKEGFLFVTFPDPNIKNKITQQHLQLYWGTDKPEKEDIIDRIITYGKMYYRDVKLIDVKKFDRITRFVFKVDKVSSLEMVGLTVNK